MVTKRGCIPLSNWAITCSNPDTTGYTLYLNGLDYIYGYETLSGIHILNDFEIMKIT